MKPLISIIIPTWNRSLLLGETLNSVHKQSYQNWECIVVDDGSTDVTPSLMADFIERDSRFLYVNRPNNRPPGGNAARNYGFEQSKGEYIQWFDSDDLMHEQLLEEQLANIVESKKEFSVCKHDRYNQDFTELLKEGSPYKPQFGFYLDFVTNSFVANLPTILFSRAAVLPYKLSETLYKSQEFEFLQRFLRNNEHLGTFLDKSLVKVRRHANSITEDNTNKRLNSALEVILISVKSLPSQTPMEVKNFLALKYLKTLYIAFRENRGTVLLPYTLKVYHFSFKKSIIAIPYVVMIWVATKLRIVNARHFKKIYKLYR